MQTDDQRIHKLERALLRTQVLLVLIAAVGATAMWWVHSLPARELQSGKIAIAGDRITIADHVRLDRDGLAIDKANEKAELNSAGLRLESTGETKAGMLVTPDRITLDSPRGAVNLAGDGVRIGTVTESFIVTLLDGKGIATLALKSGAGANSGSGITLDAGTRPIASGSCFTNECDTVWALGSPDGDHINLAHAGR